MNRLVILVLFSVLLFSCEKDKPAPQYRYSFVYVPYYDSTIAINMDFYRTLADYGSNKNRLKQVRMNPGDTADVYLEAQQYYIDVYSDDYKFNNWRSLNHYNLSGNPCISLAAKDSTIFFEQFSALLPPRNILLDGTRTVSTWKAVDEKVPGKTLPYTYMKLVFHKDFSGEYYHKDSTGTEVKEQFEFSTGGTYRIPDRDSVILSIMMYKNFGSWGSLFGNELFPDIPNTSRYYQAFYFDSDTGYYFMFVPDN